MTEHWERSVVIGHKSGEQGWSVVQEILHRRGEDPLRLACRRENRMAGSERYEVVTFEAFTEIRGGAEETRHKRDIPKDTKTRELAWDM